MPSKSHISRLVFIFLLKLCISVSAQQNHTLYPLHHVPQSNLLNPAVQPECNVFIGLPVLSSVHANIANSGFTFNQLFESENNGEYSFDATTVHKKLGRVNYLSSELYLSLLSFGIKIKNRYYLTFNIRERNDLNLFYTKDFFSLAYKGNTQFEGENVGLKNNGLNFNHFREFSIGVSKIVDEYNSFGVRVKLLFGKLNFKTTRDKVSLFTEENTFRLLFNSHARFDGSLPVSLVYQDDGTIRPEGEYYYTTVNDLVFNRKNPGFAVDAGFVHRYSEQTVLYGSILDLGLIYYGSNLTNFGLKGEYAYNGPLGDTIISENYLYDLFDRINDTMEVTLGRDPYLFFLSPRVYMGGSYQLRKNLSVGVLLSSKIMKQKIQTGVTLSATWRPKTWVSGTLSWSYLHRSINNIGAGLALGRNPVQFYAVSDNVAGFFWPQSARNLNLRFGLNIILGCRNKYDSNDCGCYWLRKAEERKEWKKKLMHK